MHKYSNIIGYMEDDDFIRLSNSTHINLIDIAKPEILFHGTKAEFITFINNDTEKYNYMKIIKVFTTIIDRIISYSIIVEIK